MKFGALFPSLLLLLSSAGVARAGTDVGNGKVDEKSGEPINNYQLIYNDLGVYLGQKLGNPCDDL